MFLNISISIEIFLRVLLAILGKDKKIKGKYSVREKSRKSKKIIFIVSVWSRNGANWTKAFV